MLVLPLAVVIEGVVASATVTAPLIVFAPVVVLKVPLFPEKSMLVEPDDVTPFSTGEVRVLLVKVCASAINAKVSLTFAKLGMESVVAPTVCASVLMVTVCAVASAVVITVLPLVVPLIVTDPLVPPPLPVVTVPGVEILPLVSIVAVADGVWSVCEPPPVTKAVLVSVPEATTVTVPVPAAVRSTLPPLIRTFSPLVVVQMSPFTGEVGATP